MGDETDERMITLGSDDYQNMVTQLTPEEHTQLYRVETTNSFYVDKCGRTSGGWRTIRDIGRRPGSDAEVPGPGTSASEPGRRPSYQEQMMYSGEF